MMRIGERFGYMGMDEQSSFSTKRMAPVALPEQTLCPPYDVRGEISWIDFSGTENPFGTPQSFIDAMCDALSKGVISYLPDREAHTLRSVLARIFAMPLSRHVMKKV